MTSNIGSHLIAEVPHNASAEHWDRVRDTVLTEVRQHFRPEFLNRVDDIILFSRLDQQQLRQIVSIQLRSLSLRLEGRKLSLNVADSALDLLAREGYDPTYGARPLKRLIQRKLEDPIAMAILEGRFRERDVVEVRGDDDKLVIAGGSGEPAPVDAETVEV
jgi:ATP-dependent Clp protease ATP-binding subunit ClpB